MKKLLCLVLCAAALILVSFPLYDFYKESQIEDIEKSIAPIEVSVETLPVKEVQPCYLFNIYDKEKMVGFVDYMFVAKVEKITGTTYRDVVYLEEENRYSALPYTCYEIVVKENIKGNLVLNETIPLRKLGGISINGDYYYKYTPETMPQENGYYLFLGYADKEGDLYVCDPNSAIYLGDSYETENISAASTYSSNDISDSDILSDYRKAYENQDTSVRTGVSYASKYDA